MNMELEKIIMMSVHEAIKVAAEEEFEEAKKRLDRRKDEIVAGIALSVGKRVSFNSMRDGFTIEVKTETLK